MFYYVISLIGTALYEVIKNLVVFPFSQHCISALNLEVRHDRIFHIIFRSFMCTRNIFFFVKAKINLFLLHFIVMLGLKFYVEYKLVVLGQNVS
jgi:hypothetical protein